MAHKLKKLLEPRSVAIVGASPKPGSVQNNTIKVLSANGFAGNIYLVNPNYQTIDDRQSYPDLASLPEVPDLVVLAVGPSRMEEMFDTAVQAGVVAICIFDSCYIPGEHAPTLLTRLKEKAASAGVTVCGGNGMGFYNFEKGVFVSHFHPPKKKPGRIGLIVHSGSVFSGMLFTDDRYRFSVAVSPGQEIGATCADFIEYMVEETETSAIATFLEDIRDPERFAEALQKARKKEVPVIVVKVGRTERSAALAATHTGALVGSDTGFDAFLRRHGALRVKNCDELIAASLLLSNREKRAASGGLSVAIDSGGLRELLVDSAEDRDIPLSDFSEGTTEKLSELLPDYLLPVNPIDIGVPLTVDRPTMVRHMWEAVMEDEDTAIGAFQFEVQDDFCYSPGLIDAAEDVASSSNKPFFVFSSFHGSRNATVRRQGFWYNWRRELTEALAHQGCHFRRPLPDEASGVV